jgi:hypothetical protein
MLAALSKTVRYSPANSSAMHAQMPCQHLSWDEVQQRLLPALCRTRVQHTTAHASTDTTDMPDPQVRERMRGEQKEIRRK